MTNEVGMQQVVESNIKCKMTAKIRKKKEAIRAALLLLVGFTLRLQWVVSSWFNS